MDEEGRIEEGLTEIETYKSAVLYELCGILTRTQNLVKELNVLVTLTDPECGRLAQCQARAGDSLGVWKSLFAAVGEDGDLMGDVTGGMQDQS